MVPILLALGVSQLGLLKLRELQNRPAPRIFGLAPKQEAAVFIAFSLIGSAFLVTAGLFWIPN